MNRLILLGLLIVLSVESSSFKTILPFGDVVQIDPFGDDSLHIRINPTGTVVNPAVQALLPNPPVLKTEVTVTDDSITNGNLKVDISNGLLVFTRVSDNKILLQEVSHSFGEIGEGADPRAPNLVTATIRFKANNEESVYGLGEHRTGKLQNKPINIDFQKSQIYSYSFGADISIPFYSSTLGYAFLWNLPSFGYLNMNSEYTEWNSASTEQLDFWVTTSSASSNGSMYQDFMYHYVEATGHPLLLPQFASGFWQCKNRYRNQSEILDIAQGYYSRSVPLSVIVVDYYHWVHFGDWSFNSNCWPDPGSMVDNLKAHGTEMMVSVWPLVDSNGNNFNAMKANGYLVTDSKGDAYPFHSPQYLYDPFNSAARQFVWQQVKKGYYDYGIKVYWLDASEPERSTPDASGTYYYKLGRDLQVGMAYPFMHHQTFHDGLKSVGETDIIFLSRSAWAGSQRFGAAVWSGDIPSTFDELAKQIRVAQNMALSGIYWWTTDIGGYGGGNINSPNFQELIVRWFQFGAFCPLFRLHGAREPNDPDAPCGGSGGPNEIWRFGAAAYPIIVQIIELREQLREYIMKHMEIAATTGTPILRPLFFDFPSDPQSYNAEDQFMFGPDWLVAPVTEYKAVNRSVYLPPLPSGRLWTNFFTEQEYSTGVHNIFFTLQTFPLFYVKYVNRT
eukprot:TRINITY_DN3075_c0_g2_i1.p1 TRINITY_DN3075_c0_g2~~TRINITY_DN3075_c0_g2_i1.p1  ORF type:complete len:673 (-),score=107.54 TRINITY_DN3075_c0_g2_i1:44-2062(-)